jgi:signal transduction histidine kinase
VERSFRRRLILVHASLVIVIALGATTAVLALRSTRSQVAQSREIDERLAMLDRLRADTRELAQSARRYMLSGDLKEQQRVLAIVHAIKDERERLHARATLPSGAVLEADLDEYVAALLGVMSIDDDDAIRRLADFEDELVRIRNPLVMTFDEIASRERARRDTLRSTQTLARGAQWAVLVSSVLGILLAIGAAIGVLRKLSSPPDQNVTRSRNELVAAADELRRPLENIIAETSRLRLGARDAGDAKALDSIATHASRVNGMLGELLDVTAIQTGAISLRREQSDALTLVDRAIKDHRDTATAHGVKLRYEAQLAVHVFADRERIRHVLDSLIQIAITSARPGAELVVHVANAEGGVRFAIIESGPGTDSAPANDLALHLCSRVVEAHGGRMGVQTSAISRTYWFTLPTEPSLLR